MKKRIICLILVLIMPLSCLTWVQAKAAKEDDYKDISELLNSCKEENIAVYEANTKTFIGSKNGDKKRYISHLTKLMTALIAYDHIKSGKIGYDTKLKTSEYANSMQGVQIWLDIGEEITVDELIKAITISNANDAAVVLAEGCCGSEDRFVALMNKRAKALGMKNTSFADSTGINEKNISTANDMAILAGELAKNNVFDEYFKTRIAEVGCKGSQLVTQNKLIGNYKGCCGYKSCYSENGGEMLCAAAKQRDMVVCAVLLGGESEDKKFYDAKSVMKFSFTHYEVYYPEIPEEIFEEIPVEHGQKQSAGVEICDGRNIIIKRGTYRQIYTMFEKAEILTAPIKKGDKVGKLMFYDDKGEILRCSITADEDVKEMDFFYAFKCLLYNLFNV